MRETFQFRVAVRSAEPPLAPPLGAAAEPPLLALLRDLRGQQVTVTAGGREISGKLIQPDPVTLVSDTGRVTVLPVTHVIAVTY